MKNPRVIEIRKKLLNQNVIAYRELSQRKIVHPDYQLTYMKNGRVLEIHDLVSNGRLTKGKLFELKQALIKHANKNRLHSIITCSWPLFEHPEYAKILGFNLIKGSEKAYLKLKTKYNITKVIGADLNEYSLYGLDKEGNIQKITFSKKFELPKFEMTVLRKLK